ncbi:hypothetical protein SLE2022_303830 [Rubroshorea leprosula]
MFTSSNGTIPLWGYLFLLVVYEYLLSLSEQYISSGSNLFFEMFGTGIFGATLFQVLGVFPQIILLLVSIVSGSEDTVESMAEMSMSMLAGSAIMQLTLIGPSVVAFGSYDLSQTSTSSNSDTEVTSVSSNSQNKKPFSLTGYGVKTDIHTNYTARIMLLSMVPFLILQLAQILNSPTAIRMVVLVSLIISVAFVVSYNTYQVFQPWIQKRRLQYVMRKYIQKNLLQALLTSDRRPDETEIRKLFYKIDKNNDSHISANELRALILGIQIEEVGLDKDDFATKVMEEFDISGDSSIGETQFIKGLSEWLIKANNDANGEDNEQQKLFSTKVKGNGEEKQSLLSAKKEKKATDKAWWSYTKAAFLILLGTGITFLLGNPIMSTLQEFSSAANIPSFLVSYVLLPFAMGFRQAFSAVSSAREKTEHAVSLTFSEIYAGVFMNNAMGLAIFLLLVYIRDLSWNVSTEVLAILIICTAMGLFASFSNKIPFWACIFVYLLYPISLLLMYFLTEVLGWS